VYKRDREKYLNYQREYKKRPYAKAKRVEYDKLESQKQRRKLNGIAWAKALKSDVFTAYGGKCDCCGESNPKFLTLDHRGSDGSKHRKEVKNSKGVYSWARKNNYPDTLRLLCWNCNCGRAHNGGTCPHEEQG
jgi:hypothetical protein